MRYLVRQIKVWHCSLSLIFCKIALSNTPIALPFLEDRQKPNTSLTYRSLDEKARPILVPRRYAIAAYWQSRLSLGERVLLVYLQGLESTDAPDRTTCPSHPGNTRSRAKLVV